MPELSILLLPCFMLLYEELGTVPYTDLPEISEAVRPSGDKPWTNHTFNPLNSRL